MDSILKKSHFYLKYIIFCYSKSLTASCHLKVLCDLVNFEGRHYQCDHNAETSPNLQNIIRGKIE